MASVIVVGGGASGALVATHLLLRGVQVRVLEPQVELARGVAYSTTCPAHLLNVPAANMSAFPQAPEHFLAWLEDTRPGEYGPCSFVPRWIYGQYIQAVLEQARLHAPAPFEHVKAAAVSLEFSSGRLAVQTDREGALHGDAVVLATGNAAPASWPRIQPELAAGGRFFNSAWEEGALQPADRNAPVLLLGSGLTAVDALLALRHNGHRGIVQAVSRRGLVPQTHVLPVEANVVYTRGAGLRALLRKMRLSAAGTASPAGWREAVDSLRPQTNECWEALSVADQRRFLRHARPFWDTHRHRMAPQIGAMVRDSLRDGSLRVLAGRILSFRACGDGIEATIALRGGADTETLQIERVINCTGSSADLTRTANPLLRKMVTQGWMQPDAHRLGAAVDRRGAVLSKRGGPQPPLYAIGPLRLGSLIESVAIPEIRVQAQELAELLAAEGLSSR